MTFSITGSTSSSIALLLILISSVALVLLTRQYRSRPSIGLKRIEAYKALKDQVARAVESGREVHVSLGRGNLGKRSSPASIAALSALQSLSIEASDSDKPTTVTAGDGTLFVASQDIVRGTYKGVGRPGASQSQKSRYVAPESSPMAYGAGVSDIINEGDFGSNIVLGHFGSEVAIISESADREQLEQIIGSDDPMAMAVAMSVTDDLILGEELYAAAAYLQGDPAHIASLQLQDILRIFIALSILVAAIISVVIG